MRAVVMGGTSGIGLATARRLTSDGFDVTVTGRDPERVESAGRMVAAAESMDGADFEAVRQFLERQGRFEHLVLAFSPGAVGVGPIRDSTPDAVGTAFTGKVLGYLHAIRYADIAGSITMISAASARAAMPGTVVLAAANGAIERMVPPLAAELAPVRVNAVAPGVVDTPWWSFLPEDARREQFDSAASTAPAGRVGTADDVAAAVAYLVGADFVTGTTLAVDGGVTVG